MDFKRISKPKKDIFLINFCQNLRKIWVSFGCGIRLKNLRIVKLSCSLTDIWNIEMLKYSYDNARYLLYQHIKHHRQDDSVKNGIVNWVCSNPNLGGLFRGSFWGGFILSCLKLVRIMLETLNLARKYKLICSFRKHRLVPRPS